MRSSAGIERLFPIVQWLQGYSRGEFRSDILAGVITAILLVPQGIAYAMLVGLPPQVGLYASILPPAIYALMGTSRTLSVGPVSIAAIMVASALSAPEVSALFIALIAYVESVAIAKVMANKRRQKIDPNQELIALGAANLASSLSGGMPVAGGFSRTMVNYSAGAVTQMAMLVAAGLLVLVVIFLSELFEAILKTSLAAVILVSIAPLVKLRGIQDTLRYDRVDGIAELTTFLGVLTLGIEEGLGLGIAITLLSYLWRTSRPHIAVVGQVPGTENFQNVERHSVKTWSNLLMIRVDENLTFANAAFVEDFIHAEVTRQPGVSHVALIFTSVSHVDVTALESLENLIVSLRSNDITLHLTEVKGPIMDKFEQSDFLEKLVPGKVFFRTDQAVGELINY